MIKILISVCGIVGGSIIVFIFWMSRPISHTIPLSALPETPPKLQSKPGQPLRLLSLNFHFGYGPDLYTKPPAPEKVLERLDHLIALLKTKSVEILTIQEIDLKSKRSCGINQVDYIAKKAGFPYYTVAITWNTRYVPHPFRSPPRNQFGPVLAGQAIFSKYPIVSTNQIRFDKPKSNHWIYNLFYLDRVAQSAVIQLPSGSSLMVLNVHLEAFDKRTRIKQAKSLTQWISTLPDHPKILAGDFNAISPKGPQGPFQDEPTIDYVNDDTLSIIMNQTGLSELFLQKTVGLSDAATRTFPAKMPNRRLDYIFFDDHHFSADKKDILNTPILSDHLAVYASFIENK